MIKFIIGVILVFVLGYLTCCIMIAAREEEKWNKYMDDDDR